MMRTLVSWSSGKDSAWLLSRLMHAQDIDIVALVTTFNAEFDRVAMHGVRHDLVKAQAAASDIELWPVPLPWPCSNADYEARMRALIERAADAGITNMAFGDLYLEEIRDYRIRQLEGSGITPLFPIWCGADDTAALARQMVDAGLEAILSCVDTAQLDVAFCGRRFDHALLDALPAGVDPCGERGEFHTLCTRAPCFTEALHIDRGDIVERDGYAYCDLLPAR